MFLKKHIKILILAISFATLPTTINAMEIKTNRALSQQELKENEKFLKKIREIKDEIEEIENEDFKYLNRVEIELDIFTLEDIRIALKKLKETTNVRIIRDEIKKLIMKSSGLLLALCEKNINFMENKNFKNINDLEFYSYSNSLKCYKEILIKIKIEIPSLNTNNKIDKLIDKTHNILLNLFENSTPKLINEDLKNYENYTQFGLERHITFLKYFEKELTNSKKNFPNNKSGGILNNTKNIIPKLLINSFKKYISRIKNENFKNMTICEINKQINYLKEEKTNFTYLEDKMNDLENKNNISSLIYEISNLIEKLETVKDVKQKQYINIKKNEIKQKFE